MAQKTLYYTGTPTSATAHSINAINLNANITLPTGQLLELATLTAISLNTHRDTFPVTDMSTTAPLGYTRGHRMYAGVLAFTIFDRSAFTRIMDYLESPLGYTDVQSRQVLQKVAGAFYNMKPDELPPFDLDILYVNEEGLQCYESVRGIAIVDSGTIKSVDLLEIKESYSFFALDWIPIQPLAAYREERTLTPPKASNTIQSRVIGTSKVGKVQPTLVVIPWNSTGVVPASQSTQSTVPTSNWYILRGDTLVASKIDPTGTDTTDGDQFSTPWSVTLTGMQITIVTGTPIGTPPPLASNYTVVVNSDVSSGVANCYYSYSATFGVG